MREQTDHSRGAGALSKSQHLGNEGRRIMSLMPASAVVIWCQAMYQNRESHILAMLQLCSQKTDGLTTVGTAQASQEVKGHQATQAQAKGSYLTTPFLKGLFISYA